MGMDWFWPSPGSQSPRLGARQHTRTALILRPASAFPKGCGCISARGEGKGSPESRSVARAAAGKSLHPSHPRKGRLAPASWPRSFSSQAQAVLAAALLTAVPSPYAQELQAPKSPRGPKPPFLQHWFGASAEAGGDGGEGPPRGLLIFFFAV